MAGYRDYLCALLSPLGVYDLDAGSLSEGELFALGSGFDAAGEQLEEAEREALTATAEGEGISRREALFARKPAAPTTALRRAAVMIIETQMAQQYAQLYKSKSEYAMNTPMTI